MEDNRIQNQIAIYMTNKKLCEFTDKLKPAPVEYYAHMHAQGEEQSDGFRAYSCIGVVLQDYSNGKGDKTVRVTANLSPGFFPFVLSRMQNDLDRFDFTEEKIFGDPDENGLSTVTKLSIKRASVGNDGKRRNYPWCIIVENGRAVKEKTPSGGTHIKSGTYKKLRSVYVNINDLDFFNIVYRTARFIESWELTFGPKLIRDARKLLDDQRVSDPCYDRDVWCCGTFGKCKTGTWEAGVLKTDMGDWGVRCAVLAVRHKETGPDYSVIRQRKVYQMKDGWLEQPIDVGVDSGQAGFYDEAFYQDNSIFKGMPEPEHDYGDLWYNHACDITLSEMSAGVMPYGVVSSSGFGDGSYVCYTHKGSDGEIDFAFVIFIDE